MADDDRRGVASPGLESVLPALTNAQLKAELDAAHALLADEDAAFDVVANAIGQLPSPK
jgi:hypothetical protein